MQNINGEQIIIDKDLFSLIEFAKWELYNFNLLKKSSKLTKVELILIDKDIIKKWKEKSGYNIFKKQIFGHLFAINKLKNDKEKIKIEKENINKKWQKLITEKIIIPNNIKTLPNQDLSGLYLSLKENKINAYKNYEVISSKLFNIFKNIINYKIIVEGVYHKGKLIIPMNYKNDMNLRTSIKSGENFMEIFYLNPKNESEDLLCILPNDNYVCEQIEEYFINESIENLFKKIFSNLENKEKDDKYITEFIDQNGNKFQYKIINKKIIQSNHFKTENNKKAFNNSINLNIDENNKEDELEKLKQILSEKIKILQNVNERINQRNNNIKKIKSKINESNNDNSINNEDEKKKLLEIKNNYLEKQKEYEMNQKELITKKQALKGKEKLLQNLINKKNSDIKLKEDQIKKKLSISLRNQDIKSDIRLDINDNYLIQEKKLKEKEEYLKNKENELELRELNIKDRELAIIKEKEELSKNEKELDSELQEINDKLIYMKNKKFLMNIKEKGKEEEKSSNNSEENINQKELDEIEAELEKEINSQNINTNTNNNEKPENRINKIELQKNASNNYRTLNSINFSNRSPTMKNNVNNRFNLSPETNKFKRINTLNENSNAIKNDNPNIERHSLNYNFLRTKTFNNNIDSKTIEANPKSKLNANVNQTETKINKNKSSLGLEQIDYPNNINAVIQCLAHIPELAEGILELGYKEKYFKENKNVELSRNFATIINNIFFPMKYNNTSKIFCPKNFVDAFTQKCPLINEQCPPMYFSTYEMVKFILDTFHDELNIKKNSIIEDEDIEPKEKNKLDLSNEKYVLVKFLTKFTNNNNSLISKLFFGLIKTKCVCNECGSSKYYFDYYSYLYFDLAKIKKYMDESKFKAKNSGFIGLNDCLNFQRREINLHPLFKEIKLSILEKFGINQKTGKFFCDKCKLNKKCSLYNYLYSANTILPIILERGDDDNYFIEDIKFPEELNLENYVEFNKSVKKYYLCGVVSNLGKNNTYGRFVAYCRMSYNGNWYCYNNEKINLCKLKDIYKDGIPYILIYHKI